MIRIILLENDPNFIEHLENSWKESKDIFLTAAFTDAKEVVAEVERHKPDVVLMALSMPDMSGIEALKNIENVSPNTKTLVLLPILDDNHIFSAIAGGASSCILKEDIHEIEEAIKVVNAGGAYLSPTIALRVMKMFQAAITQKQSFDDLTERESQILNYLVQGYSAKKIAEALVMSYDAVRYHVKNIYKKLH